MANFIFHEVVSVIGFMGKYCQHFLNHQRNELFLITVFMKNVANKCVVVEIKDKLHIIIAYDINNISFFMLLHPGFIGINGIVTLPSNWTATLPASRSLCFMNY